MGDQLKTPHVVMYSGGVGSWAAAKRVAERYGTDRLVLLAADTKSEHEDWYRFVAESAENVGGRLVMVSAGLDIWELAEQQRAIPNSRLAFCSRILKHQVLDAWCDEHAPDCVRFFGFDWTEAHRIDAVRARHTGAVDAPLLWEPKVDKPDLLRWLAAEGLTVPAAYQNGMPHNNCLRYGCVKGGNRLLGFGAGELPRVVRPVGEAGTEGAGTVGQEREHPPRSARGHQHPADVADVAGTGGSAAVFVRRFGRLGRMQLFLKGLRFGP